MSSFPRLGSPAPHRPRTRLGLQLLEDRAVPATAFDQLTASADGFVGAPAVSADGSRVAFQSTLDLTGSNPDGNLELFVYDARTGAFTQVTATSGSFFGAGTPALSADGSWVVFTSTHDLLPGGNPDGNAEVFLHNLSTGALTQVTDTAASFFRDFDNQAPTVSGDGSRIAFVSTRDLTGNNPDGSAELFLYNRTAGTFTQATDSAGGFFLSVQGPALSADGSKVAFLSDQDLVPGGNPNGGLDYFLYDVPTGTITQLTHIAEPGGTYTLPRLDADGSRVTFSTTHDLTGANADLNQEVFLWDAGTGLTQVTHTQNVGTPEEAGFVEVSSFVSGISAGGLHLALSSNADLAGGNADGNREVFLFGATAGTFAQLTDTTSTPGHEVASDLAAVNADGTRVALISTADLTGTGSNADGSVELFLATVESATPPTPGERIGDLVADVEALVEAGRLTANQAAGLLDKLRTALRHLEAGRPDKAVQMLEQFVKQVRGLVRTGALGAADGEALVAAALVIIDELT